jgi:alpha-mannosidase
MALDQISAVIAQLQSLVTIQTQNQWGFYLGDAILGTDYITFDLGRLQPAEPNENGYLIFPKGEKLAWFYQEFTIPNNIKNYELVGLHCRLNLTWWAGIAKVFVNGQLVCEGDLFDSSIRLSLSSSVQENDVFQVAIALISPGHDIGALMKSQLIFESDEADNLEELDAGQVATELQILQEYLTQYQPELLPKVAEILQTLPLENFQNRAELDQALGQIRTALMPIAEPIKTRKFYVLGHAHLDMAWLWTTDETWEVGQRTFASVLNLQAEFADLTFGHSTPALYAWIEKNRPDLWVKIQAAVAGDRWELLGGMWVEPDVNLLSGESIIRQFLYGQQFYLEKFGKIAPIAWLPDTFGFPQQLPQICKLCGIEAFATGKLHWNDTKPFPHGLFWWRSPDETTLLTFMSPPNVTGIMDTNPITMTNYALKWEEQTGLKDIFWLPGVGDHGGGPTKDMVQVAHKWRRSPFFPELEFSTVNQFLKQVKDTPNLPIWNDELYLELHRGYYTVHRDQKEFNRRCETRLRQVELWSVIANSLGSKFEQQVEQQEIIKNIIKDLWKKVLFNQFHDILPGTSIPEVFTEANCDWQYVLDRSEKLLEDLLGAIAANIDYPQVPHLEAQPIILFNDLNWERTEIFTQKITDLAVIYNHKGEEIESHIHQELLENNQVQNRISFLATVPSVGYALYWLVPNPEVLTQREEDLLCESEFILENQYLRVEINSETGDIQQIFDKIQQKNILSGAGNQLQAFVDKGQYWDAWDIATDYEQNPLEATTLISIIWQAKNKLYSTIRVIRKLNQSQFIQDYCLESHSPILKIHTVADWQEEQVILKAAFPLTVESAYCDYEVACGTIRRSPTADPAKWEVPALRWADFNDGKSGVGLINNSHHGYDLKGNQLRLTLLKSPLWPDPTADRGRHSFAYALYPHYGTWQQAKIVQQAKAFNTPFSCFQPSLNNQTEHQAKIPENNPLSPQHSFINFGDNSLILLALKPAEAQPKSDYIIRFYEAHGEACQFDFQTSFNWQIHQEVDALEKTINSQMNSKEKYTQNILIEPWKIKTFRIINLNL